MCVCVQSARFLRKAHCSRLRLQLLQLMTSTSGKFRSKLRKRFKKQCEHATTVFSKSSTFNIAHINVKFNPIRAFIKINDHAHISTEISYSKFSLLHAGRKTYFTFTSPNSMLNNNKLSNELLFTVEHLHNNKEGHQVAVMNDDPTKCGDRNARRAFPAAFPTRFPLGKRGSPSSINQRFHILNGKREGWASACKNLEQKSRSRLRCGRKTRLIAIMDD